MTSRAELVEPDPQFSYDPELPITAWHDEIAEAIRDHPVVVVAGETGSGKTTQLPKICLELGRRSIGHTQPRRIAARTVAERVAAELAVPLGDLVGYQVRFTRRASRATRLKVMTDGVLLAEIGRDRDLRRYDTIIVDEAHERSLNIDFLLGYLKQLTGRRLDLKIILTSATIDTARFAAHFAEADGTPAPIIEVEGRTYPVEIRYRPLLADGEQDQTGGIVDAVRELSALGLGDILVFCSGEREIRDAAEALAGLKMVGTETLPMYARLSAAEQHRVFAPHGGRRIVLATNIAETSLTVPGIRYVVDAGTARVSRYSSRTKVQRLPIEPISRASADQRAGRCGRVAPGVCVRLYSEEDYAGRPEFTEPEILRTNLASVILQMTAAELGDISAFPFLEAPDRSQINDGVRLLTELGALDQPGRGARPRLTKVGRRLAAVPVDPRLGRMLLEADRQGCLREMLIIVAGLSIVDPRERPAEHRDRADALHRRFWVSSMRPESAASDFVAFLNLWDYLRDSQKELSGNGFRRRCREEFLHLLRVREWQDLHTQLKQICREIGLRRNDAPAGLEQIHTAALAGLLSHVGLADPRAEQPPGRRRGRPPLREYLGARGTRFAISPGSSLARVTPPLVVAAEITETTRLWARTVAPVTAEQVEEVGRHLLTRQYSEPHWSARAGAVMAYEQVSLYGVPIVARRRVAYGSIDPDEARAIFIRSALVEGQWRTHHRFFRDNAELRAEVEALEERTRRRDLAVDDETIMAFYAARIPADVTSAAHFDTWWKHAHREHPDLLTLRWSDLRVDEREPDAADFPSAWSLDGRQLRLDYVFEPGQPDDGVTVQVPVGLLNQLGPAPFSWQVPGLRTELATELIRSLPKSLRRNLVPAGEFAGRALAWLAEHPSDPAEPLPVALGRALRALTGERVEAGDWDLDAVPDHLRMTFAAYPDGQPDGPPLATGKDLVELRRALADEVDRSLAAAAPELSRTGLVRWEFGDLAEQVTVAGDPHPMIGYPALVDEGGSVGLAVLESPQRQRVSQLAGLRRLVLLNTPDPTTWVVSRLGMEEKLALSSSPYAGVPALLADARLASVGELIRRQPGAEEVRTEAAFAALCDAVRVDNPALMRSIVALAGTILTAYGSVAGELSSVRRASPAAADDLAEQLGNLVFAGFLSAAGYDHLVDLPRYLQAARVRLDGLLSQPARDDAGLEIVLRCEDAYAELCDQAPPGPLPDFVAEIGWQIEELRVSVFAQPLRTRMPVSEKRVMAAVTAARARLDQTLGGGSRR